MTKFELRDPHAFAEVFTFTTDVTATLNDQLASSMADDTDGDGLLDQSLVLLFRPMDPSSTSTGGEFLVGAACTAPLETTACSIGVTAEVVSSRVNNQSGATCLDVIAGTTSGYDPAVAAASGDCFSTDEISVTIGALGLALDFEAGQIAAPYIGDPTTELGDPGAVNGLFRGFMSEASADAVILPADLPYVGGEPLSSLLKTEDQDMGPSGDMGWWFYLNYTATIVDWAD
jgi:hypothetical protein